MHPFFLFCKRHFSQIFLGLIIVFYLVNGFYYLRSQSITSDEGSFMSYAIRYLKGNPDRINPRSDNSKMPVTVLNMIPRIMEEKINGPAHKTDWGLSDTIHGRYVTLVISALTILLVYFWSKQLYGWKAGLFAAFLMAFCPNNLANAALVTTDSYSVLFLLLSMYLLWKFCQTRSSRYFIFFSIVVALSQLVKQSLFHLYVLSPIILIVFFLVHHEKFRTGLFLKRILIFAVFNLLILNAGYYFHQSFMTAGDYHFMSNLFQNVHQVLPPSLPVPFPRPFIDGLDMAKYYDQLGGGFDKISSFGKVTILGQTATGSGFWYYYFVSLFYKTPITYFIFFAWGSIILVRKKSLKGFIANEFFLILPIIYFLIVMSFFYQTQCGLRHIIFLYPFIFIMSGAVISKLQKLWAKIVFIACCLFLLVSVLRYWSNYFPYTNEFILDKKMAWQKVGSNNLDFRQGYFFAKKWMTKHPEVQWAPKQPQAGHFIINTEDYEDIWNRHEYDWIRKYTPAGHVAYTFLLINVQSP